MIVFKQKGNFNKMDKFLKQATKINFRSILERYGREGVSALAANTPIDSGKTADSWDYEIVQNGSKTSIYWTNSNVVNGVAIAVIIQYGHGVKGGGYVQGRDYINPVMKPIFDTIADNIWKEVSRL